MRIDYEVTVGDGKTTVNQVTLRGNMTVKDTETIKKVDEAVRAASEKLVLDAMKSTWVMGSGNMDTAVASAGVEEVK